MQEADAFGANRQLARQQSLSAADSPRCSLCCIAGGGRRGKSLAEFEFDELFRDCRGFFSKPHRALTESSLQGNAEGNSDDNDNLNYYKAPSRWQVLCRKARAEALRNMPRRAAVSRFRYDSLSYAMNFDDGMASMRHEQDEGGVAQLQAHPDAGLPVADVLPITVPSRA